jgi:ATP-binding cassette, subfamily C (CFTR/MRP), member 1
MNLDAGIQLSSTGDLKAVDNEFGPVVDQSIRTFDFTLLFEETILSILPSSIFIILSVLRLYVLSTKKTITSGYRLKTGKLVGIPFCVSLVDVALIYTPDCNYNS